MNNETKNRKAFLEMRQIELNASYVTFDDIIKELKAKGLTNRVALNSVTFELNNIKDNE